MKNPAQAKKGDRGMKLRRKPEPDIEAHQWFPGTDMNGVYPAFAMPGKFVVLTIHEQAIVVKPGDWIFPENDGIHFYPVKDAVKRLRFDEVE